MGLFLSSSDLERYRDAVATLLSPLDHPDPGAWSLAVLDRLESLFGAERSLLLLPVDGRARMYSRSVPASALNAYEDALDRVEPGGIRSRRQGLNRVLVGRRAARMDVWTSASLARAAGFRLNEDPFYREVAVPAGVARASGMTTTLPLGEAWLAVAGGRAQTDRHDDEAVLELYRMLRPAFEAGAHMLARLQTRRDRLAALIDALGHAAAIFDLDGRELHRTTSLRHRLEQPPDAERILADMQALARTLARHRRRSSRPSPPASASAAGTRTIEGAYGRHTLHATFTPVDAFGPGGGVIVTLHLSGAPLPDRRLLMRRYALTEREAQVALLLARGASNRQIGRRLGISPNTVRTHAERIFRKLGIHSRKALGLKLIDDPRTSP